MTSIVAPQIATAVAKVNFGRWTDLPEGNL